MLKRSQPENVYLLIQWSKLFWVRRDGVLRLRYWDLGRYKILGWHILKLRRNRKYYQGIRKNEIVENDCSPDGITDYSKFDTDPELFYYDAENKCSDVELMLDAKDVPEFVPKYAGAGILERMDFPASAE